MNHQLLLVVDASLTDSGMIEGTRQIRLVQQHIQGNHNWGYNRRNQLYKSPFLKAL